MDDEPMWAADRVVAPTLGSAITIPKTANEFAIKGSLEDIPRSKSPKYKCLYSLEDKLEEKKGLKLKMLRSAPVFYKCVPHFPSN
ncbi:hypothetical protein Tco_0178107 [Tanacetum coccineum]